jgi:Ras-specific guanine nucleotide-releasing factor 2
MVAALLLAVFHLVPHLLQTDCLKAECFETLSAMELAEQITLLDHIVFRSIPYE